ncbi:MAG: glycosyltransferase [Methylococcaceae bacterium]|nr:glycosyltransferase [Methylococcaceae bacterium]
MSKLLMNPRFSVIIATYNSGATLSKAIDSVLAQSCAAYEIIIVDDGSIDNTSQVASHYGDKVRYYFQENSGVSSARNQGAELAQGDWLTFLDADDWYYPQRLYWHAELLRRNPDLDFLIGDYHYGRADGSVIRRSIESSAFGLKILAAADENNSVLLDVAEMGELIPAYFGHTSTLSLPRKKFIALGGYSRSFSIAEDIHLFIRLCADSHKAGVTCNPMGVYYVHDSGLIRSDVVKAQIKTVETLFSLKEVLINAPAPIKKGFLSLMLNARFDLATALIRSGQHLKAVISFLPSLVESCSWNSVRSLFSIIKG